MSRKLKKALSWYQKPVTEKYIFIGGQDQQISSKHCRLFMIEGELTGDETAKDFALLGQTSITLIVRKIVSVEICAVIAALSFTLAILVAQRESGFFQEAIRYTSLSLGCVAIFFGVISIINIVILFSFQDQIYDIIKSEKTTLEAGEDQLAPSGSLVSIKYNYVKYTVSANEQSCDLDMCSIESRKLILEDRTAVLCNPIEVAADGLWFIFESVADVCAKTVKTKVD